MITDIESIQILIALLKQYNITNLVLSAGNRHTPFVRSVEADPFFTCYSVVDERSAAFFALGLIQETGKPAAVCCTSGTSVCNYTSGVAEACYAKLPLLVITVDRNPYYLNQQEEQMVPQVALLQGVVKKTVTLPIVKNKKDAWRCNNLICEAILELNNRGKGPVQINVPVEEKLFDFHTENLPTVRKIERIEPDDEMLWKKRAQELAANKRILVTFGQHEPFSDSQVRVMEQFYEIYGAVFLVERLSNLHCKGAVYSYNGVKTQHTKLITEMVPDIVIAMNGNVVEIREWLKVCQGDYQFWNVREDGEISDPLRHLTDLFACTAMQFMEKMVAYAPQNVQKTDYYEKWKAFAQNVKMPELEYSDTYAVRELMARLPKNALFHVANSNSVRLIQGYPMDESVKVYCNRGTNGIDGSMSTFVGQSCVHDGLCFLLIGDLSFFYDMNALWNRYVGKNIRIMLNNNGCGEIFYNNKRQDISAVGMHTAADHNTRAQGWVESIGFQYLSSTTKEEFDENLEKFLHGEYDKPVFFEVFTDKYANMTEIDKLAKQNEVLTGKMLVKKAVKSLLGK